MLTVYKSSAGSGKTYTLVKEFLKLILADPTSYKNILAVTFTNKATAEMKQRIIEKLSEVCDNSDVEFIDAVSDELKIKPQQIVSNARYALQLILHNYTNLSVQTIDSFFNKTVRSLSKELNLPLQFDVELNQELVKQMIVDALLASVSDDKILLQQLEDFALSKIEDDKGWDVEREIYAVSSELFKEKFRELVSDADLKLYDKELFRLVRTEQIKFENTLVQFGKDYIAAIENNNFSEDDFIGKSRGVILWFRKLAQGKIDEPLSAARKRYEGNEVWSKNDAVNDKAEQFLQAYLDKAVNYWDNNFIKYFTCACISKLSSVSQMVEKLEEQLRLYRKENEIILISDISSIIKTFISKSNSPFIFEKTGNRYKSFLIDEFQDTSNFQWNNFLPLIENALSEGSECLVVGDVKQSIYRWRGGNMKLLYKNLFADLRLYSSMIDVRHLNTNYRSKRTIVDFNNLLFSAAPQILKPFVNDEMNALANAVYESAEVTQHITKKNDSNGFVHIEFIESNAKQREEEEHWKEIAMKKMLGVIHSLFERNYNAGDITLLVRSNSEGSQLAEFLMANGIDKIMTSESLSLANAPQINLLVNAMKLMVDRKDFIARSVVENEWKYLSENLFIDFIERRASEKTAYILQHHLQLNQLTIYELAEALVLHFELNKKPDAYIQRFLDLMLELNALNIYTVTEFVEWWNENQTKEMCSVITSENADAIRIMTVHKSKGLQFRVVIMPFADWSLSPKFSEILWVKTDEKPFNEISAYPVNFTKALTNSYFNNYYEQEISEAAIDNLNIFYVAFTRAEEQLYVFSKTNSKFDTLNSSSKLLYLLMSANGEWSKALQANENVFEAGDATLMNNAVKREMNQQALSKFISSNWKEKITVRTSRYGNFLSEKIAEKVDYGNIVHFALSNIFYASDVGNALELTTGKYQLNSEEQLLLKKTLLQITSHKLTADWWTDIYEVKTEASIVMPDGEEQRPDRIMFKNKEAILVDYKTGAKELQHQNQLNAYAGALQQLGYDVKQKWLLYVEPFELVAC